MALCPALPFTRIVAKQPGFSPDQRQITGFQAGDKLAGLEFIQIAAGDIVPIPLFRRLYFIFDLGFRQFQHLLERGDRRTVPVAFKVIRHILHHRACCHHIQIGEQRLLTRPKIGIPDVSAANNSYFPIHGKTLVMHPPIKAGKIGEITQGAQSAKREGIKQAYRKIGMRVQQAQDGVQPLRVVVV